MPQFLFRSISFSLLLHGLLLGLLLFLLTPRRFPDPTSALLVDFPLAPSGELAARATGPKGQARLAARPKVPAIRWKLRPFAWEPAGSNAPLTSGKTGEGAGSVASRRDLRTKLYRLIDGQLTYPAALAGVGKKGRVRFTIALGKDGKLGKLQLEGRSDLDLEYWVRDDLEDLLSEAHLGSVEQRETFTLDFYLNDSFPAASGNIQGPVLSFYRRAGNEPSAFTFSQTESSKVSPYFFKNREPQVGAGIDPVMIADWILNGRRDEQRARERATLEREWREARDKRRRQAGER